MKKVVVVLFIIVLPFLCVFFYFNRVSSTALSAKEKDAAMKKILGRGIRTEKTTERAHFTGTYIQFFYPAWIAVDKRDDEKIKKNGQVLDYFALRSPETHFFLVSQVTQAAVSRLTDDTAVKIRQSQKELYKEHTVTIDGHDALVFTKDINGAEKSLFLLHDGKLYSVAATALNMARIEAVFDEIVKTMEIR